MIIRSKIYACINLRSDTLLNQAVTTTGRRVRQAFIASEGHTFTSRGQAYKFAFRQISQLDISNSLLLKRWYKCNRSIGDIIRL